MNKLILFIFTGIAFFLLGVVFYKAFPRDYNPDGVGGQQESMDAVTSVDISENDPQCFTYIYGHAIGKNLLPLQRVECKK